MLFDVSPLRARAFALGLEGGPVQQTGGTMNKYHASLAGVLAGSVLATPVLAQAENNACLQRNRILSWRALNDTTILYTDKQRNTYTLTFRDSCTPLTQSGAVLIYASKAGSLACISRGDAISVKAGGRAGATCRVASVQAGAPDQTPDQAPDQAAPPG